MRSIIIFFRYKSKCCVDLCQFNTCFPKIYQSDIVSKLRIQCLERKDEVLLLVVFNICLSFLFFQPLVKVVYEMFSGIEFFKRYNIQDQKVLN
jgi:hypothetical protein